MEIPVLNRISDFEALHQSPSNFLVSQTTLSISAFAKVSHALTFWKWGSLLLLALLATFSGLLSRIVLSFRRLRPLPSDTLFHYESDADSDTDASYSSSDDEEVEEEDDEADSETDENWRRVDEDFRVRGSAHYVDDQWQSRKLRLRHRRSIGDLFSWPDLASGKSVVKLWDNLGLGLDFQDDGNVFSLHDMNKEQEINYFFQGNCDVTAISASSPPVVVSAGASNSKNIELKVWDRRVSCRIPAILSEWHSQSKKMVSFNGSNLEKLFVRGGKELTVGDIRKVNAPIENVTESDVDAWWDADAVTDEFLDTLDGDSYKWAVARCCDAVRSHLWFGRDQNL